MSNNTVVASVLIDPNITKIFQKALGESTLVQPTFKAKEPKVQTLQHISDFDNQINDLLFMGFPTHMQAWTSRTHTAQDVLKDSVQASSVTAPGLVRYTPERHYLSVTKQALFREAFNDPSYSGPLMAKSILDYETLTLTDPKTKKTYHRIMEYAATYSSVGQGVLNNAHLLNDVQGSTISSGLIGIDNVSKEGKAMRTLMDDIYDRMARGLPLTEQQKVVADFTSRLGDEGTVLAEDKLDKTIKYVVDLTKKAKSEYTNAENFAKGQKILYSLGDLQYDAATGVNKGQLRLIKNLAYMASDEINIIETKNGEKFDFPFQGQAIFKDPVYLEEYRNLVGRRNAFPVEDMMEKSYDPDAMLRYMPAQTRAKFHQEMFRNSPRQLETARLDKQEEWIKALHVNTLVAHSASSDVTMLGKITDMYHSPVEIIDEGAFDNREKIFDRIAAVYNSDYPLGVAPYDQNGSLKGHLLLAKTAGTPSGLSFNNDIFGYVEHGNGNVYFSDGTMYSKAEGKTFKQNKIVRGIWKKDALYEVVNSDVLEPDMITDPRIVDNKAFAGQRILHLQMRLFKARESLPDYDDFSRNIHIFIPAANAEEEYYNNFATVAYHDANGNMIMTDAGTQMPHNYIYGVRGNMKHALNFRHVNPVTKDLVEDETILSKQTKTAKDNIYRGLQEADFIDSAERSVNKLKPKSMEQLVGYHKILEEGNFATPNKHKELVAAVTKAALGQGANAEQELLAIAGPNNASLARQVAKGFVMDNGEFNADWLRNTDVAAQFMAKGSVLEQLDAITRRTINATGKYKPETNGDLYTEIMRRLTKFTTSMYQQPVVRYRLEDQRGKFFINMERYRNRMNIGPSITTEDIQNDTIRKILNSDAFSVLDKDLGVKSDKVTSIDTKMYEALSSLDFDHFVFKNVDDNQRQQMLETVYANIADTGYFGQQYIGKWDKLNEFQKKQAQGMFDTWMMRYKHAVNTGINRDYHFELDLNNIQTNINRILSLNGIPKEDRPLQGRARVAVLETIQAIADSEEAKHWRVTDANGKRIKLKNAISNILTTTDPDRLANKRNAEDILAEVMGLFSQVQKETPWAGTRPTTYTPVLDKESILMGNYAFADTEEAYLEKIANDVIDFYGKNGHNITRSAKGIEEDLFNALTKDADTDLADEAHKLYQKYTPDQKYVLAERMSKDLAAIKDINRTLVNLVQDSGGTIKVVDGKVVAQWGGPNGKWQVLDDLLVHLETNAVGGATFKFGPSGTRRQAQGVINFGKNSFGLEFQSSLGYAYRKSGVFANMKNGVMHRSDEYQKIIDEIQRGVNPAIAIKRGYLDKIKGEIERHDLASRTVEGNFSALMSADMSPLLYGKQIKERMADWKNYFAGNREQLDRLKKLEEMADAVIDGKVRIEDALQFAQREAYMGLFVGSNSPFYVENGGYSPGLGQTAKIVLRSSFYEQSQKSTTIPVGIADYIVAAEGTNASGKMVGKFVKNSVPFKINQSGKNIFSDLMLPGYMKRIAAPNIVFAPGIAGEGEYAVTHYMGKYAGEQLTNGIQVPTVEMDTTVKEEILSQIQNLKNNLGILNSMNNTGSQQRTRQGLAAYYDRASRIVGKRMNLTEGGALMNGLLLDEVEMPLWGAHIARINNREIHFNNDARTKSFLDKTAFRLENGVFSYGPGFVNRFDENYANFITQFGSTESTEAIATGPSYSTIEYITKEGQIPVSAADVQKTVEAELSNGKKLSELSIDEFDAIAGQFYDKAVVNRSFTEQNYYKMLPEFEKGVGGSTTAFLGNLLHDDTIVQELQQLDDVALLQELKANPMARETVLHNILNNRAFDVVERRTGLHFRGSVALNGQTYRALSTLDFEHPLFGRVNAVKQQEILEAVYSNFADIGYFGQKYIGNWQQLTESQLAQARATFADWMIQYRNSINEPLHIVSNGGRVFKSGLMAAAKHENSLNMLSGTVQFIREYLINQNNGNRFDVSDQLQNAIDQFDQFGALIDLGGNKVSLGSLLKGTTNPETMLIPQFGMDVNTTAIEQGLIAMGLDPEDWKDYLGVGRNFDRKTRTIRPTMGTFNIIYDDAMSLKSFKITDREISGMYSAFWDKESLESVTAQVEKDFGDKALEKKFFSSHGLLIDAANSRKIAGEEMIDYVMNDVFFSRFGLHQFDKKVDDAARYGSAVQAAKEYVAGSYAKEDPYREEKTRVIVDALHKRFGNNRYLAQSAIDDLYEAASERAADEFNKIQRKTADNISAIVSDRGRNKTGTGYFLQKSIKEMSQFSAASLSTQMADQLSDFRKNIVWDMTDANIGLTEEVLGQNAYIAVAGGNARPYTNIHTMMSANKQHALLNRIYEARHEVEKAYEKYGVSEQHTKAVEDYQKLLVRLTDQIHKDVGGKDDSSVIRRLTEMYTPASLSGKVQVTDTIAGGSNSLSAKSVLEGRMFRGKSILELAEQGTHVNYMVIGKEDLASMGFDKKYFKMLQSKFNISEEQWMENARVNGISGIGHRWPSIYWGSDMAVQIYVDDEVKNGMIYMDAITAAAMKADADGDRAQAMMLGAIQKNGRFIDSSVFELAEQNGLDVSTVKLDGNAINTAEGVMRGHSERMLHQMYYDNAMFKVEADVVNKQKEAGAELMKLLSSSRTDLTGKTTVAIQYKPLSKEEQKLVEQNFLQRRNDIIGAMEKVADDYKNTEEFQSFAENLKRFREAQTGTDAFAALSEMTSTHEGLKEKIYANLGQDRDDINQAYREAYKLYDADVVALQRVARGGAGVIDNPFTAAEMVRLELLEAKGKDGLSILTSEESFAIQQMREHLQEEFLTPKQMTPEGVKSMGDLDRVTELFGGLFGGTATKDEISELEELLYKHRRPTEKRYVAQGMMKHFADETGKVDDRKLFRKAIGGLGKASSWVKNISASDPEFAQSNISRIFNNVPQMVSLSHARYTHLVGQRRTPSNLVQDILETAEGTSRYFPQQVGDIMSTETDARMQRFFNQKSQGYAEDVLRSAAGSGKWSRNILALAGAVMLTGFIGGNPATPADNQADQRSKLDRIQAGENVNGGNSNIYEQEPPPSNIQLADPSLSPSGRKQPGYVININAQTQKDKDYVSRVITQAVTRNYHNTNINVSMNVNQQPGNISEKEIADYISQAF